MNPEVPKSSRITFTLGRGEAPRCFKEDLIKGQILDVFFEHYGEIKYEEENSSIMGSLSSSYDSKSPAGTIYMTLFSPNGEELDTVVMASASKDSSSRYEQENRGGAFVAHSHKSYHKTIRTSGVHKLCLQAHKTLFYDNPKLKYEVSISIDGLFESQYEEKEE